MHVEWHLSSNCTCRRKTCIALLMATETYRAVWFFCNRFQNFARPFGFTRVRDSLIVPDIIATMFMTRNILLFSAIELCNVIQPQMIAQTEQMKRIVLWWSAATFAEWWWWVTSSSDGCMGCVWFLGVIILWHSSIQLLNLNYINEITSFSQPPLRSTTFPWKEGST